MNNDTSMLRSWNTLGSVLLRKCSAARSGTHGLGLEASFRFLDTAQPSVSFYRACSIEVQETCLTLVLQNYGMQVFSQLL